MKANLLLGSLLLIFFQSYAQVGIGTNTVEPSTALEIKATNKALLLPRVNNTSLITTPLNGMVVYDISLKCVRSYQDGSWSECVGVSGSITSLNCANAMHSGNLQANSAATNVTTFLEYAGGNGGKYAGLSITSTGVTGLTAICSGGYLASGNGALTFIIIGTPSSAGIASFTVTIGGQSCSFDRAISGKCSDTSTAIVEITSPTGKVWMDRNLGATRAATSATDTEAFGDYYQGGRCKDGHEVKTSTIATTSATTADAGHGNFIAHSSSWSWTTFTGQGNLWSGIAAENNPCPAGYRLPTSAELQAEITALSITNQATAYSSILKLPTSGNRGVTSGTIDNLNMLLWAADSHSSNEQKGVYFDSSSAVLTNLYRGYGAPVRCVKGN